MNLIQPSLRRPLTVIVLIIGVVLGSVLALRQMPRDIFPTLGIPTIYVAQPHGGMDPGQMEGMGMTTDPRSLADEEPFDEAFIGAMIPHHRSAIQMANVTLEESDNPRIKELAGGIVEAQEREISQMQTWRENWYPPG